MSAKKQLAALIGRGATERDIDAFLRNHLNLLGNTISQPTGEYVVLREYYIDQKHRVDFVVLTGRSQLNVIMVEAKAADFPYLKANGLPHANVHSARTQISNRFDIYDQYPQKFKNEIYDALQAVEKGTSNGLMGPGGSLHVDPNKRINVSGWVIAGTDGAEAELATSTERAKATKLTHGRVQHHSWNSFMRRIPGA